MTKMMTNRKLISLAGLLASAALVGCNQLHGEQFDDDGATRRVGTMNQAQSATGAKEDAMLNDMHFHGGELTSLGQGKLDLIVKGTPAGDPITVYLNVPHTTVADREAAVTAYLKKIGIADDNMLLAEGNNPNLSTPSAYNIRSIYKEHDTSFDGAAAPEAGAGTGAGGGGMGK